MFVQACRHKSASLADYTLEHEVSPQPPRVGPVTITLRLNDASGKPVDGARITIEGNMSHAGMPPVLAQAGKVDAGWYQANVELSMAGDWIVLVHVVLQDGRTFERKFEINGVASE
jgi:hypothetical protein